MIILPDKTKMLWEQNNRSDVIGTLWSSFNLNLTEQLGKTKISPRMVITTNGIANFGTPVAFLECGGDLYCIAGNYVWKATGGFLETTFAQLGSLNTFSSTESDMELFNNKIYVTADASWYRLNTDGSALLMASINSGTPHKQLYFNYLNRLYAQNGYSSIISTDISEIPVTSGTYTMQLPDPTVTITSLLQTSNLIWILTLNQNSSIGNVYTWDGATANTPTDIFPLDSRGALAGIIKDGVPYIIDTDGKLMYHNGQAFVLSPNGRLPIKQFKYLTNPLSSLNNRWIHPNGITLVDNRINILVNNLNNDNAGTVQESLPSGIWEYDLDIGWYHKSSLSQWDWSGIQTITDYGQNRLSRVGALMNIKDSDTGNGIIGTIIAGADYYVDGSTTKSASFTNDSLDTVQKYGYLVTNKIAANQAQNSWEKLFLRIRPLLNSTDKIVVKYRSNDDVPLEVPITWINLNSFTTTTNVLSYAPTINQNVGGEVEITQGSGGGMCAHVKSVVNNSGTYTVTLDEQFPSLGGTTGKARFQSWNKLDSFSTQNLNLVSFGSLGTSTWIQIKVCFLFTGNNEMINMVIQDATYQ